MPTDCSPGPLSLLWLHEESSGHGTQNSFGFLVQKKAVHESQLFTVSWEHWHALGDTSPGWAPAGGTHTQHGNSRAAGPKRSSGHTEDLCAAVMSMLVALPPAALQGCPCLTCVCSGTRGSLSRDITLLGLVSFHTGRLLRVQGFARLEKPS